MTIDTTILEEKNTKSYTELSTQIYNIEEKNNSPLHIAVIEDSSEEVYNLIQNGAKLEERNIEGDTPLHLAAQEGHLSIVGLLINAGAKADQPNLDGDTPLHLAVERGRIEVVNYFCAKKIGINAKNNEGNTPLHWAVEDDWIDIAELMLKHGANINAKNRYGNTPLHAAVEYSKLKMIGLLMNKGADINIFNNDGNTAFHHAILKAKIKSIKEFLKCSKDIKALINSINVSGVTPLYIAAVGQNLDLLKILLRYGADIHFAAPYTKLTSLHISIMSRNQPMACLLIENGANIFAKTIMGSKALDLAVRQGLNEILTTLTISDNSIDIERIRDLINQAGDKNTKSILRSIRTKLERKNNNSAIAYTDLNNLTLEEKFLSYAILGELDGVERLIKTGVDLNFKDDQGKTALYWAVKYGYKEITKSLLENGAFAHYTYDLEQTLLHIACEKGDEEISEMLIERSSDLEARDINGNTAMHLAVKNNHLELVRLLIKHGASFTTLDKEYNSPYCYSKDFFKEALELFDKSSLSASDNSLKSFKSYLKRKHEEPDNWTKRAKATEISCPQITY